MRSREEKKSEKKSKQENREKDVENCRIYRVGKRRSFQT